MPPDCNQRQLAMYHATLLPLTPLSSLSILQISRRVRARNWSSLDIMVCMSVTGVSCKPSLHSAETVNRVSPCRAAFRPLKACKQHARLQRSREVSAQSTLSQPVAAQNLAQDEIPKGHQRYETMLVLRPDLTDEDRDVELAKFEAFLEKRGASSVNAMVRGRQNLAYPIQKFWEGIYVLYEYAAPRKASPAVQVYLSTPIVGAEYNILRHMTFNR